MLNFKPAALALILCLGVLPLGCSASRTAAGPNLDATSTAIAGTSENASVWSGAPDAARALIACKFTDDDCIHAVMQKQGGSDAAYAFYQHNGAFLTSATGNGNVRLGRTFIPWAANSNFRYVLLGTAQLQEVSDAIKTLLPPFDSDPTYQALLSAGKKSRYTLWPGDELFEAHSAQQSGGQEFVFQSGLHDQCHACGIGVAARIAIDTDAAGSADSAKLLGFCQGALLTQDVLKNGQMATFHDFAGLNVSPAVTEPYLVTLPSLGTCPPHEAYK